MMLRGNVLQKDVEKITIIYGIKLLIAGLCRNPLS